MLSKVKLFFWEARSVLVTVQLAHIHKYRMIHDLWTALQEMIS